MSHSLSAHDSLHCHSVSHFNILETNSASARELVSPGDSIPSRDMKPGLDSSTMKSLDAAFCGLDLGRIPASLNQEHVTQLLLLKTRMRCPGELTVCGESIILDAW